MGERREIAGGADGALFRDDRDDALFEHRLDQPHQFEPHAGSAAAERDQLQRHDQADDVLRQRLADAAAMREDEVALQGRDIGGVDLDGGQFAEAGIDAVDRRIAGGDLGDAGSGLGDAGVEGGIEPGRLAGPVDGFELFQRDGARVESDGHRSSPFALEDAGMERVEADAVDELGRTFDIPDGEIGRLAGFQRAGLGKQAERAGRLAGGAGDAFLDRQAEERRRHVHGQQQRGQRRGAGIAIGGDRDRNACLAQRLDRRLLLLVDGIEGAGQEHGDGAGRGHRLRAILIEIFEMIGGESAI